MAIGTFAASSAAITGLIIAVIFIAVIFIPATWAAGFPKPPAIAARRNSQRRRCDHRARVIIRKNQSPLKDTYEWIAAWR
ncbi:hypothetical protein [Streptosporangium sp. NPDC051022]|uniref:hypothetical protein n=1 Tax=Streptosporangium sp. NPDC051022 TaxID=3155752 RepID=UPI0034398832